MTDQVSMLIVDDEPSVRDSLMHWFLPEGYRVDTADGAMQALDKMRDSNFDIVLLDIKMPGMDGIELQQRLREIDGQLAIIIMTAYASVDTAIQALKQGAYDYITKPVDPDDLSRLVRNAVEQRRLLRENLSLKEEIQSLISTDEIVGDSPQVREIIKLISTVAQTDVTVMIQGPSGTGKELVARAIHFNSRRRFFPLITINCGALTDTLVESDLFGHEKGAFTGAQYRRKGKLELADKGAIFFDEIGNIGLKTQMDLLRVIETKRFTRLGGNQVVNVDFRIISATNRNLEDAVKDGTFREDLYYRLNVFNIQLPSLKERASDIPLLADHFVRKFGAAMNKPFTGVDLGTMEWLKQQPWPGNVRELQNAIERAVVVGKPPLITLGDLPCPVDWRAPSISEDVLPLAEVEKRHIQLALEKTRGNVSLAAQLLDVDRATVYNKIKKYSLNY
ncbi:MAG TPA: sigma-54 dependent transcriptional regulator [Syntrophobacteraceae bacterium]|nr:sigma-54 dependent transcriptional regulator [Syntrophobacteraceae bacterium]